MLWASQVLFWRCSILFYSLGLWAARNVWCDLLGPILIVSPHFRWARTTPASSWCCWVWPPLLWVRPRPGALWTTSTLMTLFTGLGPQVSVPLTVMAPWPLSEPFTDPCCYPHLMRSVEVIIFFLFLWPFLSLLILRYRWPQSDKISQAHSAHFNAHWVTSERPSNITGHQAYLNRF